MGGNPISRNGGEDPDASRGERHAHHSVSHGAVVLQHEHTGVEQAYMLEGSIEDKDGACSAGDFVWRKAGSTYTARAPDRALFLSFFMRRNRLFEGQKFLTEGR